MKYVKPPSVLTVEAMADELNIDPVAETRGRKAIDDAWAEIKRRYDTPGNTGDDDITRLLCRLMTYIDELRRAALYEEQWAEFVQHQTRPLNPVADKDKPNE